MSDILLSPEEIGNLEWNEVPAYPNYNADFSFYDDYPQEVRVMLKAQLEKAEPLIRQDEREKWLTLLDELYYFACHGDYANGNEAFGMDEGRVMAERWLDDFEVRWQTLKEGKK